MGFIEETGIAQHYRDARIAPIYEGTNGIQALDLIGRKVGRDGGAAARRFIEHMREITEALAGEPGDDLAEIRKHLGHAIGAVAQATKTIVALSTGDLARAAAGSVAYLTLFAITAGGWVLAKQALAAQRMLATREGDARFNEAKILTARFFAEQYLSAAPGYIHAIEGGGTVLAFDSEML